MHWPLNFPRFTNELINKYMKCTPTKLVGMDAVMEKDFHLDAQLYMMVRSAHRILIEKIDQGLMQNNKSPRGIGHAKNPKEVNNSSDEEYTFVA